MQHSRARTSSLRVAPLRPTHGVWFVFTCCSAALGAHVCVVSTASWRLLTSVRAQHVPVYGIPGHLALAHRCARSKFCVCGVHGHLALVHRCAHPAYAVYDVRGHLVLDHSCACRVRSMCGVHGPLPLVHACGMRARCLLCAVSSATWRLFIGVCAQCPVCAVSVATWRLSTGVCARRVQCAVSVATRLCLPLCFCDAFFVPYLSPLGPCSGVSVPGAFGVRCSWRLGACSPAGAGGVVAVR